MVQREFPSKDWKVRPLNKLLRKLRETGTTDRRIGSGAWNSGPACSGNTQIHWSRSVASQQSRSELSWLQGLGVAAGTRVQVTSYGHKRAEAAIGWSVVCNATARILTRPSTSGVEAFAVVYLLKADTRTQVMTLTWALWIWMVLFSLYVFIINITAACC